MMSPIVIISGILFLVVLFLLFRVQQLTSVLSGELKTKIPSGNKLNGLLMILFFVVGIGAFIYGTMSYWDDMWLPLASEHGETTDNLFMITMVIVTIIFIFVNGLLFYFAFRYQHKDDYQAFFFPHNNTLEMIWTLVPAVVLAVLIFGGWKSWTTVTGPEPEESAVIEIMGKQFAWMVRYPGEDGKLGESNYTLIDDVNEIGMDCQDKEGYDDFIPREIHLVVGKPVLFKIRARDVLHSVFLPHFRQKMDAVPGMPTRFWFTPTKTTAEMQQETGNPDFKYELACTEVCGRGHFAMKKIVVVETQEEYDAWLAKQTPFFAANPDKACKKEYLPEMPAEEAAEEVVEEEVATTDSMAIDSMEVVADAGEEVAEEAMEEEAMEEGEEEMMEEEASTEE